MGSARPSNLQRRSKPKRKPEAPTADLLLELGTEELPPKSLALLSQSLGSNLYAGLRAAGLTSERSEHYNVYATPRRLAVQIPDILLMQPDSVSERRGPSWQAAFDDNGQPTAAAVGFARACGVTPAKLERLESDKGSWLVFRRKEKGAAAARLMPNIVAEALKKLPIPKRMRWAHLDAEFVRPVHWVVLLHGAKVVPCEILSVRTGRQTLGHRFHHPKPLSVRTAKAYPDILQKRGYVIADLATRRKLVRTKTEALAKRKKGVAVIDDALLDEVTALVEWPEPILASFDKTFLKIPSEPLVATMKDNQKCFPVVNAKGALLPYFVTVANIKSKNVNKVREGNERVIRARFADAQFFWETDRKVRLEDRVRDLDGVVFHNKLGSVYEKIHRIRVLASQIADEMGSDRQLADRAAFLSKADLMSGMVGEFPELQGIMGRYYAKHDGEGAEVAEAMAEQYLPRFAGDHLPKTRTGQALAVADRLDTLVGIFAIGEIPTGDKDPFALRRAALGLLRIIIERALDLDIKALLDAAHKNYPAELRTTNVVDQVYEFMMDRLRAYYLETGVSLDVYEAVLARRPDRPSDFDRRVRAVMAFRKLPEAESLTTANKRIRNILRQGGNADWDHVSTVLLKEEAERQLAQQVESLKQTLAPLFDKGDYAQAMKRLAALRPQVDEFFDKVMVMVDEEAVRDNRLALLSGLSALFLRVADLSKLQT